MVSIDQEIEWSNAIPINSSKVKRVPQEILMRKVHSCRIWIVHLIRRSQRAPRNTIRTIICSSSIRKTLVRPKLQINNKCKWPMEVKIVQPIPWFRRNWVKDRITISFYSKRDQLLKFIEVVEFMATLMTWLRHKRLRARKLMEDKCKYFWIVFLT